MRTRLLFLVVCVAVASPRPAAAGMWSQGKRARPQGGAAAAVREAESWRERALVLTDDPAWWGAALSAARAAVRQAEALLDGAGGGADPTLRQRVRELKEVLAADERDRALVERVGHIRLEESNVDVVRNRFRAGESFPALRKAVEDYGLRVGDAGPAVALIGGRPEPVRPKLVAALDFCLVNAAGEDAGVRDWLLAVLAGVDGDPWRARARRALAGRDRAALTKLVREADAGRQPPAFLALLGQYLPPHAVRDKIDLLRRAQQRYPGDFWINFSLADALYHSSFPGGRGRAATAEERLLIEEAIGYYRAALALRPGNAGVSLNLGLALQAKGDAGGAVAAFRRAIDLEPRYAAAHFNLGNALRDKGLLDEAILEYRRALDLDPKREGVLVGLGDALAAKGLAAEAVQAYRKALEIDPPGRCAPALLGLGGALARLGRYHEAVRSYRSAFSAQPELAEHLRAGHRLAAARAAALAAADKARGAGPTDGKDRAGLRRQALDWLRADLAAWAKAVDKGPPQDRRLARRTLAHWQKDPDLAGLRDPEALAQLPQAEGDACRRLWADVAALLRRAGQEK
jgi:tetratricopeptide (TPR) repeat protein